MKVVVPNPVLPANYSITPAVFGYSNATDYAAHSMATAYAVGNRVLVESLQSNFECVVAHTGTAPTLGMVTPWVRVGSTNAWKPFDGIVSSPSVGYTAASQKLDLMVYALRGMGRFTTVCVMSTDASRVRVQFSPDNGVTWTYNTVLSSVDTSPVIDAWTYFFADLNVKRDFVFDGIDGYGTSSASLIYISVGNDASGTAVQVGEIVVGVGYEIGDCHAGVKMSLNDYSRKEKDAFGSLMLVPRAYSFAGGFEVEIPAARRNKIQALMVSLRATPSVYFPSLTDANNGLVIYGFETSFEITYDTPERSYATIEIEGLI